MRVVYPGTFDPVTLGHMDIVQRTKDIFGSLDVAITAASTKETLFNATERADLMKRSLVEAGIEDVGVVTFDSLLVEFMRDRGYDTFIRGLRVNSDFEYEFQMQLMNRRLAPLISGLYLMPSAETMFLSSTLVREVAMYGGELDSLVTSCVGEALRQKFANGLN